jgi:hypothetical protein
MRILSLSRAKVQHSGLPRVGQAVGLPEQGPWAGKSHPDHFPQVLLLQKEWWKSSRPPVPHVSGL